MQIWIYCNSELSHSLISARMQVDLQPKNQEYYYTCFANDITWEHWRITEEYWGCIVCAYCYVPAESLWPCNVGKWLKLPPNFCISLKTRGHPQNRTHRLSHDCPHGWSDGRESTTIETRSHKQSEHFAGRLGPLLYFINNIHLKLILWKRSFCENTHSCENEA